MTAARAAVFAVALAAAGCGTPLVKLPAGPGAPAPDAAEALSQATATCAQVSTISAEMAVSGSVAGRRLRGRLLVGLSSPASAYLEAPAPFGAPIFVFAATGGEATLLLPRDRRVLRHGDPAGVLEAITGVPLGPDQLRTVLTGCAASPEPTALARAQSLGADWRVIPAEPELYLRRERAGAPWRLVASINRGASGWRADYADFQANVPRGVRLTSLDARRFDLRLALSQVEMNVPLDASVFEVAIPPGTQPLTIEELRDAGPLAR
jgi:outer membrane lipoprotein-sorting protein